MSDVRAQLVSDLKAARAELVARGRCRATLLDAEGRVCSLGAIGMATDPSFEARQRESSGADYHSIYRTRSKRVRDALESHLPNCGNLMIWNDTSTTTDQDVLDLFDKALADLGGAL